MFGQGLPHWSSGEDLLHALLDYQSNGALVRSEFFNLFNMKGHSSLYSLRKCASVVFFTGEEKSGFQMDTMVTLCATKSLKPWKPWNFNPERRYHAHLRPIASQTRSQYYILNCQPCCCLKETIWGSTRCMNRPTAHTLHVSMFLFAVFMSCYEDWRDVSCKTN